MGGKGNTRHINRFAASNYTGISRKSSVYLTKQNPGRYTLQNSMAIMTVLKEKMNVAIDAREAVILLKNGSVLVNGNAIKDRRYPVGFGDIITLKPSGESYRIDVAKRGTIKVDEKADHKASRPTKVIGKYIGPKNKVMLRLYDGTVLPGKADVKVNDSVTLKGKSIGSVIKFSKGAKCYVIKGAHASESGTIKEITQGSATRAAIVQIDSGNGTFQTLVDNVMVVGE